MTVLVPECGKAPATAPIGTERVLLCNHVNSLNPGNSLYRALTLFGPVVSISWRDFTPTECQNRVLGMAQDICPTLVWLYVNRGGTFCTPWLIQELRPRCDPNCVIVLWDGDQYQRIGTPERQWFVELGKACDATLMCNTVEPAVYAGMGVRNPGYLQCGVDTDVYAPGPRAPNVPPIVFLGSHHSNMGYERRTAILQHVDAAFPGHLGLYGNGWQRVGLKSRPYLKPQDEAAVYNGSQVALSLSLHNHLARYTSDRLFRALACGAVVCVEEFPDYPSLGLKAGVNCLVFRGAEHLEMLIRAVLDGKVDAASMRREARELGLKHSWEARMPEVAAILQTVREAR